MKKINRTANDLFYIAPNERLVLYSQSNFRGINVTITCDAPYMGRFNNQASSARVFGKELNTVL